MSAPEPLFRQRTPAERRAWILGWLNAYDFLHNVEGSAMGEVLRGSFQAQLADLEARDES